MYDLKCIYDTRNSFYGKAKVKETRFKGLFLEELYSYGTLVARIETTNNKKTYIYYGKYSQTTTRHQKEFFKQNGVGNTEIKELFEKGQLVKEV